MKNWLIALMVSLLGLFVVGGLVLNIPSSYGIQNISILWSVLIIILGVGLFIKLFKMF